MNILIIFALILRVHSRYLSIDYVKYLETYGYLNSNHLRRVGDITSALLAFQQNYKLEPSGVLDYQTVKLMGAPRCGVKDFNDGVRFQVHSRWNVRKIFYHLKNRQAYMDESALKDLIKQSFTRWAQQTEFEFHNTEIPNKSDNTIDIRFAPSYEFKGPYDIAEAFFPAHGGDITFKQLPHWSLPNKNGLISRFGNSLLQTAIHEIGHSLGLQHSNYQRSIMYPFMEHIKHDLDVDDIRGIQITYHYKERTANYCTSQELSYNDSLTFDRVVGDRTKSDCLKNLSVRLQKKR